MKKKYILEKLSTALFYLSILIFLIAFNFQDSKTGGWYQQIITDLGSRQISDITFTDSLTGYATAQTSTDTNYILKTTNGGDNWNIIFRNYYYMTVIQFLNVNTGFACGSYLYKTTNGGFNWIQINKPAIPAENIFVFSVDTLWFLCTDPLVGGLFRTTNGGVNWQKLDNGIFGSSWPNKIYFINSRIGFASNSSLLFRTTNSGYNWSQVTNNNGFNDMVFCDSLIGYKTYDSTRKTTDGGMNWIAQKRPNLTPWNSFYKFGVINKDTIWGVGGVIYTYSLLRGIVYKTTNGGINWGYQIPDLNINITSSYYLLSLINKNNIWAYTHNQNGIHTVIGGNDTTFYTKVKEQITNVSEQYILFQNYPNPFNSMTNVKVQMLKQGYAEIKIFDLTGKLIKVLMKQNLNTGEHKFKFDATDLTSGVYLYSLYINSDRIDTKKMLMIK
ncbi:MAG: T9SS type A sorting domain-containing protein [Ignavibacteriae bacterium]|nr:T9SS type A sorting domain-containing protein [Ignavibacteriota bacterium]